MNEIWADIPGYEGIYQASNYGNIKSLDRLGTYKMRGGITTRIFKGTIIKQHKSPHGYMRVPLYKNMKMKSCVVHRLVLMAFSGVNNAQVNHIDGDKLNNRIENLEWCTQQENNIHCIKVLRKRVGENHWKANLSEAQVLEILKDNRGPYAIAKSYGDSGNSVAMIKRRKTWKYLHEGSSD